jgi:hypothetical protein
MAFRTLIYDQGEGQFSIDPGVLKELSLETPQKMTAIPFS